MVDQPYPPDVLPPDPPAVQSRLPDGRTVQAISDAEVETLWTELTEASSYRRAAAGLAPGEAIIDVGAHIGLASLSFADLVSGARVLAFEPAPRTFACLRANLAALIPGAQAFQRAVGAQVGRAQLVYRPYIPSSSSLFDDDDDNRRNLDTHLENLDADDDMRKVVWRMFDVRQTIDVEVTTLSRVIEEQEVSRIGLLKVDVERGEMEVLRGIDQQHWPMIRRVLVEVHDLDGRLGQTVALLVRQGFQATVSQWGVYAGGTVYLILAVRVSEDGSALR